MNAARSNEMQVEALLTGKPEDRERYILTTLSETRQQVASIAQHCRYCDDHENHSDRRTWLMWMVGSGVLTRIILPLAVSAASVLLTLAITGQL